MIINYLSLYQPSDKSIKKTINGINELQYKSLQEHSNKFVKRKKKKENEK